MVAPHIVKYALGESRSAISQRDAQVLIRRLRNSFEQSHLSEHHDLFIDCVGRFFERESANLLAAFLVGMGADDTNSDLFVFPPESPVHVIRLLGLTSLNDGCLSAAKMPVVEEVDISEEEEGKAEDDSADGGNDKDSSEESEVDIGLSQEFAF